MSIAVAMILVGALLLYGGWTNRSVWALLRGDNGQPKPTIRTGQSGIRSAS